jgi:hypothetical protein
LPGAGNQHIPIAMTELAKSAATALLLVAAGACDGGGAPSATRTMKPSSEYVDKLKGLSELNRGLALRRAVQDTGGACKKVDEGRYQQDYRNLSMWVARCSDGNDWAIFIAPNGDVQVRDCKQSATLGLPACRFQGESPSADGRD